jgi:hypothetical protein
MTAYQIMNVVIRMGTFAVLAILAVIVANHRDAARLPLNAPPHCDTATCYLDLSDGREYVIYPDPITGRLAWFVQDWRDGNP